MRRDYRDSQRYDSLADWAPVRLPARDDRIDRPVIGSDFLRDHTVLEGDFREPAHDDEVDFRCARKALVE